MLVGVIYMQKKRSRANGEGTIVKKIIKRKNKKGEEYTLEYWEAQLTIGYKEAKDKDGNAIINKKTGLPKLIQDRISISGKTKGEVSKRLQEEQDKLKKNKHVEPSKMLYSDYLDKWLDFKENNAKLKRSTISGYKIFLERHIKPGLGAYPIQKITLPMIDKFYGDKLKEGVHPRTIHNFHTIVHNSLKQAVKDLIIPFNPAENTTLPKVERKEMQFLTVDEVKKLLEIASQYGINKDGSIGKHHNMSFYPALLVEIYTGMRRSELLGLKWKYVDLDQGIIQIRETLIETKDDIFVDTPKTETSRRNIAIPESVVEVLRKQKELTGNYEYVFTTKLGNPFNPRNFNRFIYSLLDKAGINRGVRVHDLRHTHVSLLLTQGVNPKEIQKRLGHASFSTTMDIYAHIMPDADRKAANKLSDLLAEKPHE